MMTHGVRQTFLGGTNETNEYIIPLIVLQPTGCVKSTRLTTPLSSAEFGTSKLRLTKTLLSRYTSTGRQLFK